MVDIPPINISNNFAATASYVSSCYLLVTSKTFYITDEFCI